MGGELARGVILGISGVLGLAIIAVLVSKQSQTSGVVTSAATGFANIIKAAVSPITAGSGGATAASVLSPFGLSNSTGQNLYI
jgi:hypothetical protein